MRSVETYLLNFSFDKERNDPIKFTYIFPGLVFNDCDAAEIVFEIKNNPDLLKNETDLKNYHSQVNRQGIGHNRQYCTQTGILKITYPEFEGSLSDNFTQTIDRFLQYFVQFLLTYFQRKRIIFGFSRITSGTSIHIPLSQNFSVEFMDSVSYGVPLLSYDNTQNGLQQAVKTYGYADDNKKDFIVMLLRRYNESLNLPYVYERIEIYWKILEALGKHYYSDIPEYNEIYDKIKTEVGVKRESSNLKNFCFALYKYKLDLNNILDIGNAFNYRNDNTHEYLNLAVISSNNLGKIFRFLKLSTEKAILNELGVPCEYYEEGGHTHMFGRIV